MLSHEQVRERAAAAAASAVVAEESDPEVLAAGVEETAPVEAVVVEDASPEAAEEVAPPVVEEVTPVAVPDAEAVAEPSRDQTGPSDQSEGEVQSDATVSVALPVEIVAVEGSDLVAGSKS